MSETLLFDYSFQHPSPARVKAAHGVGVLRYLTRSRSAKRLTPAEAQAIRAAGLQLGVVFEDGAQRPLAGREAGRLDALEAQRQARACGVPATCPIFFAVDFDATLADVKAYFEGVRAAAIDHPTGVYGSIAVVDGLLASGLVRYGWQTVAWSRGKLSARAHLYQRASNGGVPGTDVNVLLRPLPLWGAPSGGATVPAKVPAVVKTAVAKVIPTRKPTQVVSARAVQGAVGAKADGAWGPRTDAAVALVATGRPVRALQELLGVRVDGVYGPATKAAHLKHVKALQRALHVHDDGAFGPVSFRALAAARSHHSK